MYFKVDSESKKSGRRTEDPSGGGGGGVVIANAAASPAEVPVYEGKKRQGAAFGLCQIKTDL